MLRHGTCATVQAAVDPFTPELVDLVVDYCNDWWVSGSNDGTIRLWNGNELQTELKHAHSGPIYSLALLPDGRLCSGSDDRAIAVTNLCTGRVEQTLAGHTSFVLSLIALDDGRLVSCSDDRSLRVWEIGSAPPATSSSPPSSSAPAPAIVTAAPACSATQQPSEAAPRAASPSDLLRRAESTDSDSSVASACSSASATVPSAAPSPSSAPAFAAHCQQTVLNAHDGDIFALCRLPDGTVATASYDKTIKVWSVAPGGTQAPTLLHTLTGHTKPVTCLAVLPDGRLVSGSYDNTIIVWSLLHRPQFTWPCMYVRAIWTAASAAAAAPASAASPSSAASSSPVSSSSSLSSSSSGGSATDDMQRFYTVSHFDRSVTVWSLRDGCVERTIDARDADANCFAVATLKGNRMVVGCENDSLELWTFAAPATGLSASASSASLSAASTSETDEVASPSPVPSPSYGSTGGLNSRVLAYSADASASDMLAFAAQRRAARRQRTPPRSGSPSASATASSPPPLVRETCQVLHGHGGAVRCLLPVA